MTNLPTNIQDIYPLDERFSSRRTHYAAHDVIHAELNAISNRTSGYENRFLPDPSEEVDDTFIVVQDEGWVASTDPLTQNELDIHIADTTSVHGITNTAALLTQSDITNVKAAIAGVVNHGATASAARPSGFSSIVWIGTVEPSNAIDGDTWVDVS